MHAHLAPTARRAAAIPLLLAVVGCSSTVEVDGPIPDFEGTYSLLGTYTGRPGNAVEGTLVVSDQVESTATVTISVLLDDNGIVFFALNAEDPGVSATSEARAAALANDGSFSVTFSGREVIDGLDPDDCCNFTFRVEGRLSGSRITGTWTLTRDMPSFDTGTFSATR